MLKLVDASIISTKSNGSDFEQAFLMNKEKGNDNEKRDSTNKYVPL